MALRFPARPFTTPHALTRGLVDSIHLRSWMYWCDGLQWWQQYCHFGLASFVQTTVCFCTFPLYSLLAALSLIETNKQTWFMAAHHAHSNATPANLVDMKEEKKHIHVVPQRNDTKHNLYLFVCIMYTNLYILCQTSKIIIHQNVKPQRKVRHERRCRSKQLRSPTHVAPELLIDKAAHSSIGSIIIILVLHILLCYTTSLRKRDTMIYLKKNHFKGSVLAHCHIGARPFSVLTKINSFVENID